MLIFALCTLEHLGYDGAMKIVKKLKQLKTYQLTVDNIDYRISHTGRTKTYGLSIRDGKVHMNVPKRMSKQRVCQAIDDNQAWVRENIRFSLASTKQHQSLSSGSLISYLGKQYSLKLTYVNQSVVFYDDAFLMGVPARVKSENHQAYIRDKLSAWFKEQALLRFEQRTFFIANRMQLKPTKVSVRSYKARWGSCSSSGCLSFDWKLLQAPEFIIDYVIVHELSHLKHFDHSPAFWQLVSLYYPEHKVARQWLKNNQTSLARL
ncbi:hypothetical protein K661_02628 [Piscirickettsia salmonis LF-89 = ATCC VR-1361]|nr:hypothetical protein K661_02628 [Piscirickettsia salmonis LF-89 = ATCC VR-1361]